MSLGLGLAIGSSALSLGSSIFGGVKSAKEARRAQRLIEQQQKENKDWYDRRYNEDYTQTAEAQNIINAARNIAEKQWKRADGAAAVAGGTDEAVAQAKSAGNEMIAQAVANLSAQGTARKGSVDSQYMQRKNELTNMQINALQGKAQAISGAAGQAANAFGQLSSGLIASGQGSEAFNKLWGAAG